MKIYVYTKSLILLKDVAQNNRDNWKALGKILIIAKMRGNF